jgi:Leu/Phe-tRNA-protein transferase
VVSQQNKKTECNMMKWTIDLDYYFNEVLKNNYQLRTKPSVITTWLWKQMRTADTRLSGSSRCFFFPQNE